MTADSKEPEENPVPQAEESPVPEPFLYNSCLEFLAYSALTYCVADLRELARKGKLSTDEETLTSILQDYGARGEAFSRVLNENKEALKKQFGEDYLNLYLGALESLISKSGPESRLLVFNDDNSHEELVYCICKESDNKRIVVAFRGSETKKDWLVDADVKMKVTPNPLVQPNAVTATTRKTLRIHEGFYDYLFHVDKETKETKLETIVKQVIQALEDNPGYHLCVTGHSLGASLSMLFAFEAAADPRIPEPVICINFASPRVGNDIFRLAFQDLEMDGKVRCLRVVNDKDVVPEMPTGQCKVASAVRDELIFRHAGMELKQYEDERYKFIYLDKRARLAKNVLTWVVRVVISPVVSFFRAPKVAHYHSCTEYMKRLRNHAAPLQKIKLSDLYLDLSRPKKEIVSIRSHT